MALGNVDKREARKKVFDRLTLGRQREIKRIAEEYYEEYVKADLQDGSAIEMTKEGDCYARNLAPIVSFFNGEQDPQKFLFGEAEYKEIKKREFEPREEGSGHEALWDMAWKILKDFSAEQGGSDIWDYWAPMLLSTGLVAKGVREKDLDPGRAEKDRECERLSKDYSKAKDELDKAKRVLMISICTCFLAPIGFIYWLIANKKFKEAEAAYERRPKAPERADRREAVRLKVEPCQALSDLMRAFHAIGEREGLSLDLFWAYAYDLGGDDDELMRAVGLREGYFISATEYGSPTREYGLLSCYLYSKTRYRLKDLHPVGKEQEVLLLEKDAERIPYLGMRYRIHPVLLVREKK